MNIKQKIFWNGVISVVAAFALGAMGLFGQRELALAMQADEMSAAALRNHLEGDMMHDALRADVLAALLAANQKDADTRAIVEQDFTDHSAWFKRALKANAELPLPEEIKRALTDSKRALDDYIANAQTMIELAFEDLAKANAKMPEFVRSFEALEEKNEALSEHIQNIVKQSSEDGQKLVTSSFITLIVSAAFVMGLLMWINRSLKTAIIAPIENTIAIANAMAQGDLRQRIAIESDDEIGQLQRSFATMQNNLTNMIEEMQAEANVLRQTAGELSQTANSVVTNSNYQSDNATTIASAMEEMIRNIDQIANHASSAKEIAGQSENSAVQGSEVILGVVDGMNGIASAVNASSTTIAELGKASEEIFSIIQVIRSIADQTNLLALNAAIEAARAGEAGRGFAVVADEVRNLAARTAQSTQEITDMIGRIQSSTRDAVTSMEKGVTRVQEGVNRAQQAGDSIEAIRDGAKRAAKVVEEISGNIGEQSQASNEIAKRVDEIATTSRNASDSVRLLADASQRLSQIAEQMQQSVARFQVAKHPH